MYEYLPELMQQNKRITKKTRHNKKYSEIILQIKIHNISFYIRWQGTRSQTVYWYKIINHMSSWWHYLQSHYFILKNINVASFQKELKQSGNGLIYFHGIFVCTIENKFLIECTAAIPMPPQIGIAAVHSICSHTSWFLFRYLPWPHLYSQLLFINKI